VPERGGVFGGEDSTSRVGAEAAQDLGNSGAEAWSADGNGQARGNGVSTPPHSPNHNAESDRERRESFFFLTREERGG
jgi:hypothetical protein